MYWRIPFTMFGVSAGFACIISATVPATTGAAMLVPLSVRYGFVESSDERPAQQRRPGSPMLTSVLPGAASDTVPAPGATRSGLAA